MHEFEKGSLEPQNIEQGMSNFEVFEMLVLTSAVRYSLFDIRHLQYFVFLVKSLLSQITATASQ
jgi:hypothetical protein